MKYIAYFIVAVVIAQNSAILCWQIIVNWHYFDFLWLLILSMQRRIFFIARYVIYISIQFNSIQFNSIQFYWSKKEIQCVYMQ